MDVGVTSPLKEFRRPIASGARFREGRDAARRHHDRVASVAGSDSEEARW